VYNSAPANRKDLFEGSVNFHWRGGFKVLQTVVDYAARQGSTVIPLDGSPDMSAFQVENFLWVQVPVTANWYEKWGAKKEHYKNFHMFQQIFKITAVDVANKSVTIDKPLEFDVWKNSTFDGSTQMEGKTYDSKVTPLKVVQGVGFENFYLTQEMTNSLKPEDADYNYGNLAPEYAMHGIVFKWAANCWVRNIHTYMTGSHPIVTEAAKNLQFQDNFLNGAWNKGKGGNGYFRGSRVWDSLYQNNTLRNLRHFTFQWSASNNVAIGNDLDCDLNLHGGWERRNLFELNIVRVPYKHAPGRCTANCGGESGGQDTGQWYPIWWGAGEKASKWSGATGPQNVFFNNKLQKQLNDGGSYNDYSPYYSSDGSKDHTIFQFGWNPNKPNGGDWEHLSKGGVKISDWAENETVDFSVAPHTGVNALRTDVRISLFLNNVSQIPGNPPGNSFTSRWMKELPGTKRISEFTIPGTHDTCALYGGASAECQNKTLKEQLEAGIRFIDIRCRHFKNAFTIHHGIFYQNINFSDVQDICIKFLESNPSECIIMSVKNECSGKAFSCTDAENTLTFEQTFDASIRGKEGFWYLEPNIPVLNTVRRKIVLFRRFPASSSKGIDATNGWPDDTTGTINAPNLKIHIQDQYTVPTLMARTTKWERVKALIEETQKNTVDWYINFASGTSMGAYPNAVAGVVNTKLGDYIARTPFKNRIGTILMDFADDGIVKRLISIAVFGR
jgi:hypothetical protein